MPDAISVHADDVIGRIAPETYGHFIEHLGRCVYGGIWVGADADVDHREGIREDTLGLLADLDVPLLRWPGGCFADDYHWEDGIGPREERPRRRNLWWAQGRTGTFEEPNAVGTEEFLRLCRELDAEPYLAANVGTGSPEEALNWMEYCNSGGDTEYADRRREHGREEPHGVRYWGVGNENWGCGGRYDPDAYAREYRRYANYLRAFDRSIASVDTELVACGHTSDDWNREFLDALGDASTLDHLSVHRYYEAGDAVDFSDEEYYELLARAERVEADVERAAATIDAYAPSGSVGVIVDEWGVWHPRAAGDDGLEQPNTVRDALSAAAVLDGLNRHADVVTMANLAQTVNVLQCVVQTDDEAAWPTPTYRVFDLYTPHSGAQAVRTVVETGEREVDGESDVSFVDASVSLSESGLYLTVSNRDLDARTVEIGVDGTDVSAARGEVLFAGQEPAAHSTRANAGEFAATDLAVDLDGTATVELPGASVAGLELT